MTSSMIKVEVAYALADQQKIIVLEVAEGCTALEAAQLSKIDSVFSGLDLQSAKMGVFGKAIKAAKYHLKEGDRVEIYRPLLADPKEVRRKRAEKAKEK